MVATLVVLTALAAGIVLGFIGCAFAAASARDSELRRAYQRGKSDEARAWMELP